MRIMTTGRLTVMCSIHRTTAPVRGSYSEVVKGGEGLVEEVREEEGLGEGDLEL